MGSQFAAESPRIHEAEGVPEFYVTDLAGFEMSCGVVRVALGINRSGDSDIIVKVRLAVPLMRRRAISAQIDELIAEHAAWH